MDSSDASSLVLKMGQALVDTHRYDEALGLKVVAALGDTRSSEAVEVLADILDSHKYNKDFKQAVISALGATQSSAGVSELEDIYRANRYDTEIRSLVIQALGSSAQTEAITTAKNVELTLIALREVNNITVAKAEGPAINGMAIGTIKGSPSGKLGS